MKYSRESRCTNNRKYTSNTELLKIVPSYQVLGRFTKTDIVTNFITKNVTDVICFTLECYWFAKFETMIEKYAFFAFRLKITMNQISSMNQ